MGLRAGGVGGGGSEERPFSVLRDKEGKRVVHLAVLGVGAGWRRSVSHVGGGVCVCGLREGRNMCK